MTWAALPERSLPLPPTLQQEPCALPAGVDVMFPSSLGQQSLGAVNKVCRRGAGVAELRKEEFGTESWRIRLEQVGRGKVRDPQKGRKD